MHTPLQLEILNNIAILTLNMPQKRNALSLTMLAALHHSIDALAHNKAVKAIILQAQGSVFSSGHDLKELTAMRNAQDNGLKAFQDVLQKCANVMQLIHTIPQPVIACVEGVATAAGCQLVASCDLAICSPSAQFCTPGVNIGLFCSTPMVAVSRNIAPKHAMEMLLLGDLCDADIALRFGLVNRISQNPRATALEMAQKIASKSSVSIKIGKPAFYAQKQMPLTEAYHYTSEIMAQNMLESEAIEGIGAVLEKREARF
jgi:enoyl-CoA hydratase/carnithine racemase